MRTPTKILFATAVLGTGVLFVLCFASERPPRRASGAIVDASSASPATSRDDGKQELPQREGAPIAAALAAWLDHPYHFDLEVLVVDRLGLPVQGHTLRLSLPGGTMNDAPSASGPDGKLTMSWPSRLPDGAVVLVDERDTRRRVELRHGTTTRVPLLGTRRNGQVEVYLSFSRALLQEPRVVGTDAPRLGKLFVGSARNDSAAPHVGLHPFAVFDTSAATAKIAAPPAGEFLSEIAFDSNFWGHAVSHPMRESKTASEPNVPLPRIAGTVFGEDGKPAAKVPVVLLGSGPQPVQQLETDEQGQFAFEQLLAAAFTVRAGGDEAGLATTPAVTTTGTTTVTLNLHRDSCVRGKALAANGSPLPGALVSWRAADGTWCDETTSREDGSFVLANLPGTAGTVLLWAPGDEHRLPVASAANVLCDGGELVLRAAADTASALRVVPVLPEGAEGGASVRLWNLDLGIATRVPEGEAGEPHGLGKLGAGWYRVEVYHAATGWIDAGRHWIDGKTDCDLGRLVLPVPATVKFELDPGTLPAGDQRAFEICSLRRDVDVRLAGVGPADTLLLPSGDYVFAWRADDGAVHFHRFAVVGGREVTIRPAR